MISNMELSMQLQHCWV